MVDVDQAVATAVDTSAMEAAAKQIVVESRGENGLEIFGSQEQIGAAISNLVANAVAYSGEGSRVAVTTQSKDDQVQISVVDQGIGIPPEDIDRIFERFYRVDPARHRSTGGTGLGPLDRQARGGHPWRRHRGVVGAGPGLDLHAHPAPRLAARRQRRRHLESGRARRPPDTTGT